MTFTFVWKAHIFVFTFRKHMSSSDKTTDVLHRETHMCFSRFTYALQADAQLCFTVKHTCVISHVVLHVRFFFDENLENRKANSKPQKTRKTLEKHQNMCKDKETRSRVCVQRATLEGWTHEVTCS